MKTLAIFALAITLGLGLSAGDAEAKRLGGSKSIGMQRQMTPPAKAPDAAPKQTAPTAGAPTAAAAAAPAAAAAGKRSWMGPIAGLAAGLGLAALASHFGFGEELANFMMMALLGIAVIAAIGFFMRKRAMGQPPALAGAGASGPSSLRMERHLEPTAAPASVHAFEAAAPLAAGSTTAARIPADFDVAGFVRNAKVHYIRLQAANDTANLDDIREFTTPEMFAEIKMDIGERNGAAQHTDVVAIEADVIEVAEDGNRHIVSVRFNGQIREDNGPLQTIEEVWHLVKPITGQGGWLLAGIQQIQ